MNLEHLTSEALIHFEASRDSVEIYLIQSGDKYELMWGDYVANTWCEEFSTLSTALSRLAQLIWITDKDDSEGNLFLPAKENWEEIWNYHCEIWCE